MNPEANPSLTQLRALIAAVEVLEGNLAALRKQVSLVEKEIQATHAQAAAAPLGYDAAEVETIIETVAHAYRVTPDQILSHAKPDHLVWARYVAIYLARKITGRSSHNLGRLFHRGHQAIAYAVDSVRTRMETEPRRAAQVTRLETVLRQRLAPTL